MGIEDKEFGIELSKMISQLRLELAAGMGEGEGKGLRFVPESVELELKVSVGHDSKGKTGIKFWVAEAGVEGGKGTLREHTIKLRLLARDLPGGEVRHALINAPTDEQRK